MASALHAFVDQVRSSSNRSENSRVEEAQSFQSRYVHHPMHRHRNATSPIPVRNLLILDNAPTLQPLPENESMESWASDRLSQAARKHETTGSEKWADILCFYDTTAANGAPARDAPDSPSDTAIPQTISSSDPKIAAQQASDMKNIVRRKLTGYVGFANLPNQWHRKSVRKGFNFNVMVVGKYAFSGFCSIC